MRKNNRGDTALHFAVRNGHLDIVKALCEDAIKHEHLTSDLSKKYHGKTVMRVAALAARKTKDWKIVSYILDQDYSDKYGQKQYGKALLLAVEEGELEIARHFCELSTRMDMNFSSSGDTPFDLAVSNQDEKMLKMLFEYAAKPKWHDPTDKPEYNRNPQFLLETLERRNNGNKTVMSRAAFDARRTNNWKIVSCILDQNYHDWRDYKRYSYALLYAVKKGNVNIARRLFKLHVHINRTDNNSGNNAFHYAVLNKNLVMLKLLFNYGNYGTESARRQRIALKRRNNEGNTPLHCALLGGNQAIINLFLTHIQEEYLEIPNNLGKTVMSLAARDVMQRNDWTIVSCILAKNYRDTTDGKKQYGRALYWAVEAGNVNMAERLCMQGARTSRYSSIQENTPLHCAVLKNDLSMLNLLLRYATENRWLKDALKRANKGNKRVIDCAIAMADPYMLAPLVKAHQAVQVKFSRVNIQSMTKTFMLKRVYTNPDDFILDKKKAEEIYRYKRYIDGYLHHMGKNNIEDGVIHLILKYIFPFPKAKTEESLKQEQFVHEYFESCMVIKEKYGDVMSPKEQGFFRAIEARAKNKNAACTSTMSTPS